MKNSRAAEPITKREWFAPKHPDFHLEGKRVAISWVCQINMELVVFHKARLAHHQYYLTYGVDLGFIFSVWVDEAEAGNEPPVWLCCGTVVKRYVAHGVLCVGAHPQSRILASGIDISAEICLFFLYCLYWSKPHIPLKSMLLHQCKNEKRKTKPTKQQTPRQKNNTTKLQGKGGNGFGISFSGI